MNPNQPRESSEAASGSRVPFTNIPDHELIREIGRGSYGEVWLARNTLGTYRAVKIVYRQTFTHDRPYEREFGGIQKFEPISRAHEGLVDILQVGRNNEAGYFYYVMELADDAKAEGETYLPRTLAHESSAHGHLSVEECIQLGLAMTSALAYLHKQGLIHRDIKPSNIIFVNGVPKLADIGLVTDIDATRSYVGTEGFIPPEGPGTPQSDIYSLGKVLYEISTGKDRQDYPELPTKLDETASSAGLLELNEVIIKACRAAPRDRYQSAEKMHADLLLLQAGRSVKHARKLERRVAVVTKAGIAAGVLATIAIAAFLFQQQQATHALKQLEAERANRQAAELTLTLHQRDLQRAEEAFESGSSINGLPYLARILRQNPAHRLAAERLMAALSQHGYARLEFPPLEHSDRVTSVQFSRDGRWILTATADKTAWIWDASNGRRVAGPLVHTEEINTAEFSQDGKMIVTASQDGSARVWDSSTGEPLTSPLRHGSNVNTARFSPDGKSIVTASKDWTARVWDTRTGQAVSGPMQHKGEVVAAQFSPDGLCVLSASRDKTARTWDARTGKLLIEFTHGGAVSSACFSPDGQWVVTASYDKTARVWDAHTGQPVSAPMKHTDELVSAEFSPDGQRVVTASEDQTAQVWDARTGEPIGRPMQHAAGVRSAMFSPEGLRVVTASWDRSARLWDAQTGKPLTEPFFHEGRAYYAEFHPEGQRVIVASGSRKVCVWNVGPTELLPQTFYHDYILFSANMSPDGKRLVTTSADKAAIWDASRAQGAVKRLTHGPGAHLRFADFSPDGRWVLTAGDERTARVWDAQTGELRLTLRGHSSHIRCARFSHNAQWIVTASDDRTTRVFDSTTGEMINGPMPDDSQVRDAQWSPDDRLIRTLSANSTARLWDAQTGRLKFSVENVRSAEFSPDSHRLVTASPDGTAQLWNLLIGRAGGPKLSHSSGINSARFNPAGTRIVTASSDLTARVWDADTGHAVTAPLRHREGVADARFSSDGLRVVTASDDKTARIWDAQTGQPLSEPFLHEDWVWSARFIRDGRFILTTSKDKTARIWEVPEARVPVPAWLPDLAEVLAGQRINSQGLLETVPAEELFSLKLRLEDPASHGYVRWAKWFLSDVPARTLSPSVEINTVEYVRRLIKNNEPATLRQAIILEATNAIALARLARLVLRDKTLSNPRRIGEADWLSRRAIEMALNEPEVLQARREVMKMLQRLEPALRLAKSIPPRDPKTNPNLIDLSKHYNAALSDDWDGIFPGNNLAPLPRGVGKFHDVMFDVRGIVQLAGTTLKRDDFPFPEGLSGIEVRQRCKKLHVLHACMWAADNESIIGSYLVHYADGQQRECPIVYGRDVNDWWLRPQNGPESGAAVTAWTGENRHSGSFGATIRLFITHWANPLPESEIVSLDFKSTMTPAAPFLIAVTAE